MLRGSLPSVAFFLWLTLWSAILYRFAPNSPTTRGPTLPARWYENIWCLIPHAVVAMYGSFVLGILPELIVTYVTPSRLMPRTFFSPIITLTAMLLGYYLGPKFWPSGAVFAWVGGLLWLAYGYYEVTWDWSPRWSDVPRWQHAWNNLFDPRGCGSSECLYMFFFTGPFSASIAYSVAAWLGVRRTRKLAASH